MPRLRLGGESPRSPCQRTARLPQLAPAPGGTRRPADQASEVGVYTDSAYVKENEYNAPFRWPQERWTGRGGKPIENAHLWKQLMKAIAGVGRRVEFEWCKGHKSTNPHNKAVDK